jgi:hypothetical protein
MKNLLLSMLFGISLASPAYALSPGKVIKSFIHGTSVSVKTTFRCVKHPIKFVQVCDIARLHQQGLLMMENDLAKEVGAFYLSLPVIFTYDVIQLMAE